MGQTPQDYYIFPNSLSRRWKVFGRRSKKGFGAVEILVNNAGVAPAADFLEMADKLCDEVMRVNVYGAYNCCKTFLAPMIDGRGGHHQHRFNRGPRCLSRNCRLCDIQTGRPRPGARVGDRNRQIGGHRERGMPEIFQYRIDPRERKSAR